MFKYFNVIFLIISISSAQFAFSQDKSGSTELSVDECYSGDNTEFSTGCIPNCVCVVAEGCPCCNISDILKAILNPQNPDQNAVIVKSTEKFHALDAWELTKKREEAARTKVPTSNADKATYYTDMALLFLPDNKLRELGIYKGGDDTAEIDIDIDFGYFAYAACWYGGVLGGGDVVDVGDECKEDWID